VCRQTKREQTKRDEKGMQLFLLTGPDPAQFVASVQCDLGARETSHTHGKGIVTNRTYNQQDNLITSIDLPGYPGLSFAGEEKV